MKVLLLLFSAAFASAGPDFSKAAGSFRSTMSDLVKADTTNPPGNEARAVKILAKRLKAEGIPFEIVDFGENRQNLVARIKGDGSKKPLILLAHLDVVGTKDQNWSTPPHELTEKDGFYYGRGVADDLGMALVNLEVFLALKREKVPLKRDVILAFTGDEESGGKGIRFLIANRPDLLNDAEIALNEGGGIWMNDEGKPYIVKPQVAEKIYQDFELRTTGETGHSSIPKKNNAIYKLAQAVDRLAKYKPERRLLPVTRAYFTEIAKLQTGELAKALSEIAKAKGPLPKRALKVIEEKPLIDTQLYTSCVATMLTGGTKANALPPTAAANVNCRILPDEKIEDVHKRLIRIVNDPEVQIVAMEENGVAGPSPIDSVVMTAIKELSSEVYPGLPVVPSMMTGATDSRFLRPLGIQAYGFSAMATYEKDTGRAHGVDERIPVASVIPAMENMYQLVLKLGTK